MKLSSASAVLLATILACHKPAPAPAPDASPTTSTFEAPETLDPRPRVAVELAGKTRALSACRFEPGAPLPTAASDAEALPSVAAAPDGSLYVLASDRKLRHYHRTPSRKACELVLDRAFGLVDVSAAGSSPRVLVDGSGSIYVSTASTSMKVEKRALAPFASLPAFATVFSKNVLLGDPANPTVRGPGGETRQVALKPMASGDHANPSAEALGMLGDEIVVVGSRGRAVQELALDSLDGQRHLEMSGTTAFRSMVYVNRAARIDDDVWAVGGVDGVNVWRFDKKGTLVEQASATAGVLHPPGFPRSTSIGPDGSIWSADADWLTAAKKSATGLVLALLDADVPRGTIHGKAFAAHSIGFRDDESGHWHLAISGTASTGIRVELPGAPATGAVVSSDAGGAPLKGALVDADNPTPIDIARYRIEITKWDVSPGHEHRRIQGLAAGRVMIDMPDQQSMVAGDFEDATVSLQIAKQGPVMNDR